MSNVKHLTMPELEAGLANIRRSPINFGVLELIVRRPRAGQREVLDAGRLDLAPGLVRDNWRTRGINAKWCRPAEFGKGTWHVEFRKQIPGKIQSRSADVPKAFG